ncbi:MAG TPA: hypothetical protein VM597_09285 [Gemmataceae bacterium]|nr:hypothetical protein [Gemmataceae bacterium]
MAARSLTPLVLVLVVGCGSPGPDLHVVTGRVVFGDGRPVSAGVIEFAPPDGGPTARGRIGTDGRFTLMTGDRPGAVAGPHRIAVVQAVIAEGAAGHAGRHHAASVVHPRFAAFATSGLAREVAGGAANDFLIEVEPAAPAKGW